MLVGPDRHAERSRDQRGAWKKVKEATDTQPDQEQLDRITHRTLVDVQLGNVMMYRVRQP